MLYLYSISELKNNNTWQIIFCVMISSYCILNIANTIQLTAEHKRVNELEKIECEKIGKMINEHEGKNNIEVKNIVAVVPENRRDKAFFDETKRRTVVTYNNLRHYWAYSEVIQYYLKNNLTKLGLNLEETAKYVEYVKENNLKVGDIVCIGDTLYCPQYMF